MRIRDTGDLWWKNAVVYCLDVETFMDWDDDGIGDFPGLVQRIDHLADLGVTCLWLMPFYPTADRDDGYDITDFLGVDPRLGDLGDVVELVRTARDRGIRVIVDLVVNTRPTATRGSARRGGRRRPRSGTTTCGGPTSRRRPGPGRVPRPGGRHLDARRGLGRVVPAPLLPAPARPQHREPARAGRDRQDDRVLAGARHLGLPRRRRPVRADRRGRDPGRRDRRPHDLLRVLRAFVGRRSGDAILMGEVNLPYEEQARYFGDGDPTDGDPGGVTSNELTLQFDFNAMQALYLSLARHDATPLAGSLAARPPIPATPSGPRSCATTTSSRSTSSRTTSAPRCSRRSGPRRTCSSTGAACDGGCPRCWVATRAGCGWCTRCSSRCRARRCCSTARRSAWARTSTCRGASPCGRPCSGPPGRTAGSPAPRAPARGTAAGRRLRARARQRRRPAPGPGVAAHVRADARAPLPRVPRAGLGRHGGARLARAVRAGAAHHLAGRLDGDAAQPVAGPGRRTGAAGGLPDEARLVDVLDADDVEPAPDGSAEVRLDGYGFRWLRVTPPGSRRLL